jgi:hypothetical protein
MIWGLRILDFSEFGNLRICASIDWGIVVISLIIIFLATDLILYNTDLVARVDLVRDAVLVRP